MLLLLLLLLLLQGARLHQAPSAAKQVLVVTHPHHYLNAGCNVEA
jgi:hypothetical protein